MACARSPTCSANAPAHRLVHHRRAVVEGEAGRPVARRPSRHAVRDAGGERHPGATSPIRTRRATRSTSPCRLCPELAAKRWDEGFETFPPTSLQISNLHAGTGANNVIPGEPCRPCSTCATTRTGARKSSRPNARRCCAHGLEYSIHWHRGGEPFFTPEGPLRSAARARCWRLSRAKRRRKHRRRRRDARFIAPLGAQCIEVGPVNASIHKVDEHVSVADLEVLPDLYLALIERLLC